ncbi:MAG: ABC transporter permease [Pseudomonadota bacterium]
MVDRSTSSPTLSIRDLNVYYGQSHALQGVDLTLDHGVLSVVGRNGMGKTTMCKSIMGLEPVASGSISFNGQSVVGMSPAEVARRGIGYVPQGRRLWPSLTVDEHLKLVAARGGAWTVERIYSVFPRLAERKSNGGGQLSGGEQQMLAIGRALLLNPKLLVMDEPTEGLAPVIVNQLEEMLIRLGEEGDIDVLVIEQNIGVACAVAEQVAIMVNGRINRVMDAGVLSGDRDLQQALLGVGRHAHDETPDSPRAAAAEEAEASGPTKIYLSNPKVPTRWSAPVPVRVIEGQARTVTTVESGLTPSLSMPHDNRRSGIVYVCGTLDTKREEHLFIRDILKSEDLRVAMVDLSTSGKPSGAEVPPHSVAAAHPRGSAAVFTGDRGTAVAGMTAAFERWVRSRDDIAGLIGAGGSGGTALLAPGFRVPPVGVPKFIVSTVASGNTSQYVGPADITMMHSVADVQGINSITRDVLSNAAYALAGMVKGRRQQVKASADKPAVGMTMFGVTTPCVQAVSAALSDQYDCLVFHATGTGGRSMEKLLSSGKLDAVIDLTTTEVCDMVAGGVFAADDTRFDASIASGKPFIGSCGALDMVNFNAPETVPEKYRGRLFYEHNPQITLMRTTVEENVAIGEFIGEKLNRVNAPVRFFLPEGGVSLLDAPGQPFWHPEANAALFKTLEETVRATANRQLVRVPMNINDPEFSDLVVKTFRSLHAAPRPAKEA